MRFLGIKQGGTTMDASKNGTKEEQKKKDEEATKKLKEGEAFVLDGSWSGGKMILTPENWENIIKKFFWRTEDVFKNLYDFKPIRSLLNYEEGSCLYVTDLKIVEMEDGINLDTHCHRATDIERSSSDISELEKYKQLTELLITRKQEWIIWHAESIWTEVKDKDDSLVSIRVLYKISNFKKVESIIPFLKKETSGASVIDSFYLMLDRDVSEQERRLEKKKQARDLAKEIYERAESLRR